MRRLIACLALVATLALAGCSDDPNSVAGQAKSGGGKGYVAGSGLVEQLAVDQRKPPVAVAGTTLTGESWDVERVRGSVVVLNVWGSWCAPCVPEVDELNAAVADLRGNDVVFMGIDYRESAATALAFAKAKGMTYPSLADDGGKTMAALHGTVVATPTTLVLDRQGRIAARVSGPVTAATVRGLVEDVLAEGAA